MFRTTRSWRENGGTAVSSADSDRGHGFAGVLPQGLGGDVVAGVPALRHVDDLAVSFVVLLETFGTLVNEVLELAYLFPNATPLMTNSYCTGVL